MQLVRKIRMAHHQFLKEPLQIMKHREKYSDEPIFGGEVSPAKNILTKNVPTKNVPTKNPPAKNSPGTVTTKLTWFIV
jgi:hypothetical protein